MELKSDLLNSVSGYFSLLEDNVEIVLQKGDHPKKQELQKFLTKIVSLSKNLSLKQDDLNLKKSLLTFSIANKNQEASIFFSGIPGGHEFNSFILAILHSGGHDLKLDEGIIAQIASIDKNLTFKVFVSLDCQICPDVVQSLNKIATINPNINCETIDGGMFQEEVKEKGIQAVPTIFLNRQFFSSGKTNIPKMINNLMVFQFLFQLLY